MKRKLFCIIFAFIISLSVICMSGCDNGDNNSFAVTSVASRIVNDYASGGYVTMNIDIEKVRDASVAQDKDKSYVFTAIYKNFLDMSSGLFFNYFKRNNYSQSAFDIFTKNQNINLESRLNEVESALSSLKKEKTIYEDSDGNLRYKEVVNCYNVAVDKMYNLNYYFAGIYFKAINFNLQEYTALSSLGSKLNDYLWYQICQMSRVAFGYEVINYVYSNPFGDMTEWYNRSTYTQEVLETANPMVQKLKTTQDLGQALPASGSANALAILKNIDAEEYAFLSNYSTFVYAKNLLDIPSYLKLDSDSEREAYLSRCSVTDRSRFNIVFNFLNNSYTALTFALNDISNYVSPH